MLKKAIIALVCAAVAVGGCCFLLFFRGGDRVTFMQRQYINQYLASNPFEADENGGMTAPAVAVACGTDGYGSGEFLGARNAIDYGTGYIEVKVAVNAEGEPVLAEAFSDITESSTSLSRVIKQMETDSGVGLVVRLSEYSHLSKINYLLTNSPVQSNSVVAGVNENALEYVKRSFPRVCVLCDYGAQNKKSLEEIRAAGADGILISGNELEKAIVDRAEEQGLAVWVDCRDDIFATVKAAKLSADGIISSVPDFVLHILNDWCEQGFDLYFKIN